MTGSNHQEGLLHRAPDTPNRGRRHIWALSLLVLAVMAAACASEAGDPEPAAADVADEEAIADIDASDDAEADAPPEPETVLVANDSIHEGSCSMEDIDDFPALSRIDDAPDGPTTDYLTVNLDRLRDADATGIEAVAVGGVDVQLAALVRDGDLLGWGYFCHDVAASVADPTISYYRLNVVGNSVDELCEVLGHRPEVATPLACEPVDDDGDSGGDSDGGRDDGPILGTDPNREPRPPVDVPDDCGGDYGYDFCVLPALPGFTRAFAEVSQTWEQDRNIISLDGDDPPEGEFGTHRDISLWQRTAKDDYVTTCHNDLYDFDVTFESLTIRGDANAEYCTYVNLDFVPLVEIYQWREGDRWIVVKITTVTTPLDAVGPDDVIAGPPYPRDTFIETVAQWG